MAAKASESDEIISDINVVPLVDIILVVLIIFMVTSPAVMKPSMPVDLPAASSSENSESNSLQVVVTADGRVLGQNMDMDEFTLKSWIATEIAKVAEVQVLIAADQFVDYGEVIRVMDWVKSSGAKNLAVTTDQPLEDEK